MKTDMVSDAPFFSFKKILLLFLLRRTQIWKDSAGAFSWTSYTHRKEGKNQSEAVQHKAGCSLQDNIYMAGHDKGSRGS